MNIEKQETEDGVKITVENEEKIAIAVDTGDEEIIYLPWNAEPQDTYYSDGSPSLMETDNGYKLLHLGHIENFEIIGQMDL